MKTATFKRLSLWLVAPLCLISCQSQRAITVSPSVFQELYVKPRYQLSYTEYKGAVGGYQYITETNVASSRPATPVRQLYRTPDTPAVRDLVRQPQSPIVHDPAQNLHLAPWSTY